MPEVGTPAGAERRRAGPAQVSLGTQKFKTSTRKNTYVAEWPDEHLVLDPAAAGQIGPLVLQVRGS